MVRNNIIDWTTYRQATHITFLAMEQNMGVSVQLQLLFYYQDLIATMPMPLLHLEQCRVILESNVLFCEADRNLK